MEPSVYDHVRPTDDHPAGVYRVVGVGEERVTLLRVTDADGRRVHTGELRTVDRAAFAEFEPAENPDEGGSLLAAVAGAPSTAYWSLRAFGQQLAAHPIPAAVALALVAAGALGDAVVSLPNPVFGLLILAGSLGLAYVGSGAL
jgi:hypothetical protein